MSDKLTKGELIEKLTQHGVPVPKKGSGKNGSVLKSDLSALYSKINVATEKKEKLPINNLDLVVMTLKFEFLELGSILVFEQKLIKESKAKKYKKWLKDNRKKQIEIIHSDPPREYSLDIKVKDIQVSEIVDKDLVNKWIELKDMLMIRNIDLFDQIKSHID